MSKKKQVHEEVISDHLETEGELNEKKTTDESNTGQESEEIITALNLTINDLNDKYLRLNAEFQNYRKRVEKEKSDIYKFGNEKLFIEMLSIMDNFERAMNTIDANVVDSKFIDGMNLIKKSFDDVFEKNGVKKINALGEPFNHDLHHAVIKESRENTESEIVIEVLQEGYTLNERLIRPSMVKVSE